MVLDFNVAKERILSHFSYIGTTAFLEGISKLFIPMSRRFARLTDGDYRGDRDSS